MTSLVFRFLAEITATTMLAAPPLAEQVVIRRTDFGVPHILAQSEAAAAFGFAYCQAEDHLPTILIGLAAARGELARATGNPKDAESDFTVRRFRVYERSVNTYHKLDPDFRAILEGFAAGLDFYLEKHPERAPPWLVKVTGHDVAAYGTLGVQRFAFDRDGIIRKFLDSKSGRTAASVTSRNEDLAGSNMWAFAPSRTTSGHAILMGNPHQAWSPVATYYEGHFTVPGKLNFYGSTFVGRPILTTGFNEQLGWSHTVNYPDLEEIYELSLDSDRPDHYLFDNNSLPLERQDVTVQVPKNGALEPATRVYWHTPLGPVLLRTDDKIYILRSACYDEFRAYQQWYRMTQAKNRDEFRQALATQAVPMFNICYADRAGNIDYLWNGTVPMLPHAAHEFEPVPAASSDEVWTRIHPLADLPQLANPLGGYVQNCNAPPYFTNLFEPLDINRYPPYFERHRLGFRTQHSLELVHGGRQFSLEEIRDLKFSPRMLLAERIKDDLASLPGLSGDASAAARVLKDWDGTVAADSAGGVLFERWWSHYAHNGSRDFSKPVLPDTFSAPWTPQSPMSTPRGLGNPERAASALSRAATEIAREYGRLDVPWGDVHRVKRGELDLPVSGGSGFLGCFRVLDFTELRHGRQYVRGGDGWIFTVEFADPPRAYSVLGYSQSEIPGAPHFADQTPLFCQNQMKPVAFTEPDIQARTIRAYRPGEETVAAAPAANKP